MARQTRIKKRRLKEDQLVTFTVRASKFIQRYYTQVVAGAVVLVVAVGAILVTAHFRRNAAKDAEEKFALAMSQYNARDVGGAAASFAEVADKNGGQTGQYSRYFLGRSLLSQNKLEEALNAFDKYISEAGPEAPFYGAAVIGKATCLEGLHNYQAAAALLEQLSLTLKEEDPRLNEVLFRAGRDYERAGARDKAREFFQQVAEKAAGPLKDQASVAIAMLE